MKSNKIRVWWIRNVPNTPLYVEVASPEQAIGALKALTESDLADAGVQTNAGGLETLDDTSGEWEEWYDEEGNSIDDLMREEERQ
jgi:hypothetical protein